jgi:hypothetical protein
MDTVAPPDSLPDAGVIAETSGLGGKTYCRLNVTDRAGFTDGTMRTSTDFSWVTAGAVT